MADYKTIHGTLVRSYTTDPDNLITGQVWYDKTNKVLQFQAEAAGAWATGGNLNTARTQIQVQVLIKTCSFSFWWRRSTSNSCNRKI